MAYDFTLFCSYVLYLNVKWSVEHEEVTKQVKTPAWVTAVKS